MKTGVYRLCLMDEEMKTGFDRTETDLVVEPGLPLPKDVTAILLPARAREPSFQGDPVPIGRN